MDGLEISKVLNKLFAIFWRKEMELVASLEPPHLAVMPSEKY